MYSSFKLDKFKAYGFKYDTNTYKTHCPSGEIHDFRYYQ